MDIGPIVGQRPTLTPLPTPTSTPLPSADGVAQAYLTAWQSGQYELMYSLLTPSSQGHLSPELFQTRYRQAQNEATVEQIETQLQSLLHNGGQASATFHTIWQTRLFKTIEANNHMFLKFEAGRWGVEWQPTLVLPQLGEAVTLNFLSQPPARGNIYDQKLHALASQGQMVTVGLVPQYLEDEAVVVDYLSTLTRVKPEVIRTKLSTARPDWFVPIADITFETSLEHDNLLNNIAGLQRRAREVRVYNDGETASHIIGYMGPIPAERKQFYLAQGYKGDELVGLSGIEGWGEETLAGKRGGRLVTLSATSQVLAELGSVTAKPGSSIHLTIETDFQATVERLLGQRLGAIVVMDLKSGALRAMASYPRFRPAVFTTGFDVQAWIDLYSNEQRPLVNRASQGTYPPASIFKVVTMAAALEAIGLKPDHTFVCTGKWAGLGQEFSKDCWLKSGHGKINFVDGLTQSCDVVFYEVGLALHRTDPRFLPDWARNFGLGLPTGLVGVEESAGVVPDDAWKRARLNEPLFDGDSVNSAIGQGFMLATPVQITGLMAAIANEGQMLRPRLIDRIVDVEGNEEHFAATVAGVLPLRAENLQLIRGSLEAVVSGARGTARQAFEGITYTVAGKTGTAESGQETPHAWFAGYAPADQPRVAITVILEHAGEGSQVAAPLFRQVLEAFFEWETTQS
jgi:penicillin-binding protein 2